MGKTDIRKGTRSKSTKKQTSSGTKTNNKKVEKSDLPPKASKSIRRKSTAKIDTIWKHLIRPNKNNRREYEINIDLISEEESNIRIINFLLISGMLIGVIATILTIIYPSLQTETQKMSWDTLIVENEFNISNMIVQQLAIIYDNGSVVQAYFDRHMNITHVKPIMQLSKSDYYYLFFYNGILNLASSDLRKKMIRYHPNLNNLGHEIIPNSDMDLELHEYNIQDIFEHGIHFAQMFLFTGSLRNFYYQDYHASGFARMNLHTYMWNLNKHRWVQGPYLLPLFEQNHKFCLAALNRSVVMFLVDIETDQQAFIYDFDAKQWVLFPSFKLDLGENMHYCTAAVYIDKHQSK